MKIILATWLADRSLGRSLTKKGARKRLLSYHFLQEQRVTSEQLEQYVKTGETDTRKNK